jgi:hypothetical protein
MWLGHNEVWLFGSMFMVAVALDLWLKTSVWSWPATIAVLALAIVANVGSAYHDLRLCGRCGANVRELLDPIGAVERRRRALMYHHANGIRVLVPIGLLVVAVFTPWQSISLVSLGIMAAMITYGTFAQRAHGRLMPWCPYCDHGGGWDDQEFSPEPEPVGQGER